MLKESEMNEYLRTIRLKTCKQPVAKTRKHL